MCKYKRRIIRTSIIILVAVTILAIKTYSYAEFEFKCPEHFSTDEERRKHYRDFLSDCIEKHPDWTIREVLEYRYNLLIKHNCEKTLENIRKMNKENEPFQK